MQRALGTQQAELIGWHCQSIWQLQVASTRGAYLITIELADDERRFDAKVVLKVLPMGNAAPLPREADLYHSGVPASLRGGLTPRSASVSRNCRERTWLFGLSIFDRHTW